MKYLNLSALLIMGAITISSCNNNDQSEKIAELEQKIAQMETKTPAVPTNVQTTTAADPSTLGQFKFEDVTFFKTDNKGILRCLPRNAPHSIIMTAESATLKLDNQKNGWKGVCVHQEANGEAFNCPVKALAR